MKITLERLLHWIVIIILLGMVSIHYSDKNKIGILEEQLANMNTRVIIANNNAAALTEAINKQNELIKEYRAFAQTVQNKLNVTIDEANNAPYGDIAKIEINNDSSKSNPQEKNNVNSNNSQAPNTVTDSEAIKWLREKSADY